MELKEVIKELKTNNDYLKRVIEYYGVKFKDNKALCPFHSEKNKSFSIKDNKYRCFTLSCNANGDIIDFIQDKEGLTKLEATKKAYSILGLKCDLKPSKLDNLKEYIEKNNKTHFKNNACKLEDIYIYENEQSIPVLARIKFKDPITGKKEFSQANIVDGGEYYKLDYKGNKPNLLYNLPKVLKAIKENKDIFIVEGEKDANTLNKLGFVATTSREVSSINEEILKPLFGGKIVVIGDNDETGIKHINNIRKLLKNKVTSFKVPTFNELEQLGNKADITDIVNFYYNKGLNSNDIKEVIKNKVYRTLDENNIYELQQDLNGIYQTIVVTDKETGIENKFKNYITNFNILNCEILRNKDTQDQIINITVKSNLGTKDTIEANARELFLDAKTFNKILGID